MNKIEQLQAEYKRVSFIRHNEKCSDVEIDLIDKYLIGLKKEIKYLQQNGVYKHAKS